VSFPEAELRAGVQPLEELLDEHRHIRKRMAALWAKYGPGGVAEHLRKAELARIVEYLRAMAISEERKVTESALDAAAHSHKHYLDFVAQMTQERAEYFELHAQLQEIEWKVNRGQAMIRYSTIEMQGAGHG
jgi:hypothetical protein